MSVYVCLRQLQSHAGLLSEAPGDSCMGAAAPGGIQYLTNSPPGLPQGLSRQSTSAAAPSSVSVFGYVVARCTRLSNSQGGARGEGVCVAAVHPHLRLSAAFASRTNLCLLLQTSHDRITPADDFLLRARMLVPFLSTAQASDLPRSLLSLPSSFPGQPVQHASHAISALIRWLCVNNDAVRYQCRDKCRLAGRGHRARALLQRRKGECRTEGPIVPAPIRQYARAR